MLTVEILNSVADRFWAMVRITPDGCWEWQGARIKTKRKTGGNYGLFRIGAKLVYAHRVSFQLENGPIADEVKVLHHCDNPPCVRPDELFTGSILDNNRDCIAKGRNTFGDRNGRAKLDDAQIIDIRTSTESSTIVGARLDVSPGLVRAIRLGTYWKHVNA